MRIFRRVLRYVRPYWSFLAGAIVCTLFFTLFSGLMVWMLMPTLETLFETGPPTAQSTTVTTQAAPAPSERLDDVQGVGALSRLKEAMKERTRDLIQGDDPADTLVRLCLVYILVVVLKNIFAYLQGYLMAVVGHGLIRDLRVHLFDRMSSLSLDFFDRNRTGVLLARVTSDVELVNQSAAAVLVDLFRHPLSVLVFFGMAVIISPWLTLVSLLVLPLSALLIDRIGRSLFRRTGRLQTEMGNVTSVLSETLGGIRVVKAFDMQRFEVGRFAQAADAYFRRALRLDRVRKVAGPASEVLAAAVGVGILYLGGTQVLGGDSGLSAGEFLTFLLVLFSMFQPVRETTKAYGRLQSGLAAAERVFEIIDLPPTITDRPGAVHVPDFTEAVTYDGVSFAYEERRPVLEGIDLTIPRGAVVALVGPSGAGKTTLADLLPRFYDPTGGAIRIDGRDIREFTVGSLRRMIGVVTQETILFNDSVAANIAYGGPDHDREAVAAAARAANAHDFIEALPDGYETMVGDRGVRLSGGQRQRIAIARAVLKNPPILVLDEATSNLDTESEQLVQEALEHLMRDRTTLVIAHRLSTVQRADLIVVLEDGRVVQQGTHTELHADEGGLYRRLHDLQFAV